MNMSFLPPETSVDAKTMFGLIELIADPAAAKDRLSQLLAANAAATAAAEELRAKQKSFADEEATHKRGLADARAAHDAALRGERVAYDADLRARTSVMEAKERELQQRVTQVAQREAAVESMRRDLERRLSLLKQATGA
jgi:hypothetical protein